MRPRWSLAMRIAIANSFMLSLFSFVNRFFFMPTRILQQIENRVLSFLSKVPFTRSGLLAHLKKLYGINSEIMPKSEICVCPTSQLCCPHTSTTPVTTNTSGRPSSVSLTHITVPALMRTPWAGLLPDWITRHVRGSAPGHTSMRW